MRIPYRTLLAALAILLAACVSNPDGGCPRAGLDSPRRCKRLCVLTPSKSQPPLPCSCDADCLCWKMAGHSASPGPQEVPSPLHATDLAREGPEQ
jgi:hypothetical protein